MLLGLKCRGHRVNRCIFYTKTALHRHSLGGVTSRPQLRTLIRHGLELSECLLVGVVVDFVDECVYQHLPSTS